MNKLLLVVGFLALATAEIYFQETFDGSSYQDNWVTVTEGKGKFDVSAGPWYGDEEADVGLRTSQDAKFYATSAAFDEFSNEGKTLVVQFSVRFPQKIDCGGGYVKVFPDGLDQENMNGDSEYSIMFGPDICGTSTKRVHVIFNYKGKNLLTTKSISCETDQLTHIYTLIVNPDNTYEVRIDGDKKASGSLFDDWEFLLPKDIPDPEVSKPDDWVDERMIDDPEDVKPEGWDDIPKLIVDPDAEKPDDWDDEDDGEWDAPMISNPEYKGEWHPKRIKNPDYIGEWEHPMIPNPDYVSDDNVYLYPSLKYVGIDIWQVKSGTIFDNILITDSIEEAENFAEKTFSSAMRAAEKDMFDDIQEAEREAARLQREAEAEEEDDEEWEDEDDAVDEDDLKDEL